MIVEAIHGSTKAIRDGDDTPFSWTTKVNAPEDAACNNAVVIPNAPASAPSWNDWDAWVKREGGVHAYTVLIRVALQGKTTDSVVLHALRVGVDSRGTPRGVVYEPDGGCGGLTARYFGVNLDDRNLPVATKAGRDGTPAVEFPYAISSTEPEVFLVSVETSTCDCAFHLDLDWTSGDREGTARIYDGKDPFRVVGADNLPKHNRWG
ncbi:hypothetical protein ABZ642_45360 [Streptomyces sp. NPDC007157]|uniref:hypothetical protein n=1 Tax=Streptomyces sp. NPDC007157 TaxID=3154681 RepID=UPI0033EE8D4C